MNTTITRCDICHREIKNTDGLVPDGRGGYTSLWDKYPRRIAMMGTYGYLEMLHELGNPELDLCLECSMDIYRHIRTMWWEKSMIKEKKK